MKAFINQQLFEQTALDSGELTMLGAVIHNFPEPGEYHGAVLKGKQTVATFRLKVDEQSSAMQTNIDLSSLADPEPSRPASKCECHGAAEEAETKESSYFIVCPRGYAIFYVSKGTGGFTVQVNRVNEQRILFNSRELQEGDLFAATLIRPGSYSVTNIPARSKGEVVVSYPKEGKTAFRPSDPIPVEARDNGFFALGEGKSLKLEKLRLEPGQGQLYRIKATSRIRIELNKPDDGPKVKQPLGLLSWRRQAGPRASNAGPSDVRSAAGSTPPSTNASRRKLKRKK